MVRRQNDNRTLMRFAFLAAAAALLLVILGGCVPQPGPPVHANLIIVRQFAFSPEIVALDPSFGFSLRRGAPGVPPRQRAESVGRAVAYSLADTATQQLDSLGYGAVRSDTAAPEPGARALVITGRFRHIDEGRRRRVGAENSSLAVDVEIDYQAGEGTPQRITALHLDSRRIPRSEIVAVGRDSASVNTAAARVGGVIARYVADLARLNVGLVGDSLESLPPSLEGELRHDRQAIAENPSGMSITSEVDSTGHPSPSPLELESPPLRIPASAIAAQRLFPGELLQAHSWTNPWAYEAPSYVEQTLLRKFTPSNGGQASPLGHLAAPTRIMVPALGVDSRVIPLDILDLGDSRTYATPKHAVGHIPESASPGEAGSAWFFGHLESPIMREGAVFRDLPKIPALLRQGETVYVIADNGTRQYLYKVTSTQVVHQNDMRLYDTGQATIHLVTCVPSLVYDHRLIVTGQLVGIH